MYFVNRSGAKTLAEAGVGEGAMLLVFRNDAAGAPEAPPTAAANVTPQQLQPLQQLQQLQQLLLSARQQRRLNQPLDFSSKEQAAS